MLEDSAAGVDQKRRKRFVQISVIIPTYNRSHILSRTLPTVLTQDFSPDQYEVIVVVDGSTDATVEFLQSLRPRCGFHVIQQPNRKQAAARNAGLERASGDLVLFLDDDIICGATLLDKHFAAHNLSDSLVVFGPVLVSAESPSSVATDWALEDAEKSSSRLVQSGKTRWPIDAVVDTNRSVPLAVLRSCSGFNSTLGGSRENTDLGIRLWRMGLPFKYEPEAVVHQLYVKSERDLVRNDAYWYGRNEVILCRKHPYYRSYSWLANLGAGGIHMRRSRELITRAPLSPEPLLRLASRVLEKCRFVPSFRSIGVRLLKRRIAIASHRGARQMVGSWPALHREFGLRLPILLYHHVGPLRAGTDPTLTVSPKRLERDMRWLAKRGYIGIKSSDWLKWCREGKALPDKPVLITFDDGYADTADHALPILLRYGFSAAIYVVTGQIGGRNAWDEVRGSATHRLMTAEQIRKWVDSGFEVGAHSRTHPEITALHGTKLDEEILGSAEDLTRLVGIRPSSFAYPYGLHNETVRRCISGTFDLALTCDRGINDLTTDLNSLKRTMVLPTDSLVDLECRIRFGWSPVSRARARLNLRRHQH